MGTAKGQPGDPSLRLSVVIITCNERERLQTCLRTLLPAVDLAHDEIVVVDNGSTDESSRMVQAQFPQVVYWRLSRNIGVGPARNEGIRLARGRYIMTLDNDTRMQRTAVPLGVTVEEVFTKHRDIGLFAFGLKNPDGSRQRNIRRFPNILQPFVARISMLRRIPILRCQHEEHSYEGTNLDGAPEILDVDYVLGANQVFRRETALTLGGYDEHIFFGPEDCEFCLQVRRLGFRVCLLNRVIIEHEYQRRTRQFAILTLRHAHGFYYMFWKHRCAWKIKV